MPNLLLKKEVFEVVGCAMDVLNVLGHGLHEKVYERALCVELRLKGIPFSQQKKFVVEYKGEVVGEYIPDVVVFEQLVLEAKTVDQLTDRERGQMLNYLRITGLPIGVLLNFKNARLEWERLILTK